MHNSVITIRVATATDAGRLAELRYQFRAALAPVTEEEAAFVVRCREWMQARLVDERGWYCWVAEQDSSLLGALWLQLIEKVPNPVAEPEWHAYITNFYVCDEARDQGLGTRLLQTALAWSRARELHSVILWPSTRSRPLYLRHGFAVSDDVLELSFDESGL